MIAEAREREYKARSKRKRTKIPFYFFFFPCSDVLPEDDFFVVECRRVDKKSWKKG